VFHDNNMEGLWKKLSAKIKAGELEEISHAIGKKLVDSNRDIWSEFGALLDIFCENENQVGRKEEILGALEERLAEVPGDDIVRNCMFTQNFCIKPIFRSLCEETEKVLLHENKTVEEQRGELEMMLFAALDTPKGTPSTSTGNTPVKAALIADTSRSGGSTRNLRSPPKSLNSLTKGMEDLSVDAASICLNCIKCGGRKKGCSQCLMLLKTAGMPAATGVVGSIKQQVAAARLLGKDGEKAKASGGGGPTSPARTTITGPARNISPVREAKSAPPSSKPRNKLQSARDEKHFCDDNDII
jgi:hypothetical protein